MLHQIETFFCVTGRLCGNSPVTGEFPAKASDTELWCFLICVWKNGRVNNREASDLRRHRAHYDVTVMELIDGMADGRWGISSLMCTRTWWTAFSKLNHSTTITLLIQYYATELIPTDYANVSILLMLMFLLPLLDLSVNIISKRHNTLSTCHSGLNSWQ